MGRRHRQLRVGRRLHGWMSTVEGQTDEVVLEEGLERGVSDGGESFVVRLLDLSFVGPIDLFDIVGSDILAPFELELGGDVLSVEFAVVPLEEGGDIFADEAHSIN